MPHRKSSAACRFPNFRQPGALGAIGNSLVFGSRKSVCTHHLDGVDVEMVSSSSLGVDGPLRVWLAGKFFAGLATSHSFPIRLWAARGNHFALQPITAAAAAPPMPELHPALGGGTLVLARPWSRNFSTFFAAAKALWVGLTSCNCYTRQPPHITTGN